MGLRAYGGITIMMHGRRRTQTCRMEQVEAAKLLGLSQPDVSRLLRGNFREYSMERLLRLLTALGRDVDIVIRERDSERPGRLTVEA